MKNRSGKIRHGIAFEDIYRYSQPQSVNKLPFTQKKNKRLDNTMSFPIINLFVAKDVATHTIEKQESVILTISRYKQNIRTSIKMKEAN